MALAASVVWEVRTGGSSVNGGGFDPKVASPGTDFSQQNAAQTAYSDLVIGNPSNNTITSAAHPFGATHPGNLIQITGGTGFTKGTYEILSVSGVIATLDRAVGTAGSTAGTGNMGGALGDPAVAAGSMVAGNTCYVKNDGTYTQSLTSDNIAGGQINPPSGSSETAPTTFIGYTSTRTLVNTDTPPTITVGSGANSILLFNLVGSNLVIRNFLLSNTGGASSTVGIDQGASSSSILIDRCQMQNLSNGMITNGSDLCVYNCYAFQCVAVGYNIHSTTSNARFIQCIADTCGSTGAQFGGFLIQANNMSFIQCFAINNVGPGFDQNFSNSTGGIFIACNAYNNLTYGWVTGTGNMILINCDSQGNGITDIRDNLDPMPNYFSRLIGCAAQVITSSNFTVNTNILSGPACPAGLAALTTNPWNNPGGKDFSLNSQAGGGFKCQNKGYPNQFQGIPTQSFWDIGAVQHNVP